LRIVIMDFRVKPGHEQKNSLTARMSLREITAATARTS